MCFILTDFILTDKIVSFFPEVRSNSKIILNKMKYVVIYYRKNKFGNNVY